MTSRDANSRDANSRDANSRDANSRDANSRDANSNDMFEAFDFLDLPSSPTPLPIRDCPNWIRSRIHWNYAVDG